MSESLSAAHMSWFTGATSPPLESPWRSGLFSLFLSSVSATYSAAVPERDSEICEAASVYDAEAEAAAWPWGEAAENVMYSIRVPEPPGRIHCSRCRAKFSAAGPTGYAEDSPICDMCLLEGCQDLGMVLALVSVVRAFARVRPAGQEDYQTALNELGAFCRIYEQFAAKAGPPRIFKIPGFTAES